MTKKISWQEVNALRKALQEEIVSLLKERNITELQLEFDEDSQSPTYVVDYCGRHDAWYEKQVTAVGICEDGDWYLKVYDNQEDEHSTIYASETTLATNNIDWLVSIRDNICEILKSNSMPASKTIYLTVRVDIFNPNVEEITDDEAQDVVSNLDYEFQNYKDYEMQTEICGIND